MIFDEREPGQHAQPPASPPERPATEATSTTREAELEAELSLTQQRLQAIIEEYETSQEEMKASNEEMQSTNEELRSTMEELETSKEELQSMNEELQTVNQENRHKVEELAQLSGDLQNLMAATDIATLFLDRKLRILRFTPQVEDLFNVRMTDRGRPLADLTHRLGYDELQGDAKTVLKKLVPIEREVQDEAGRWYLTRLLPYRSTEDRIEGVVITFVEITRRKETEVELRASEQRLQKMVNIEGVGVLILNESGTLIDANDSILDTLGYSREDVNARRLSWRTLTPPEWRIVSEQQLQKLAETGRIGPYEKEYLHQDGTRSWMLLAGAGLGDGTVVKYCIDVSDRKQAESDLRESQDQLAVEVLAMQRLHQLVGRLLNCEMMDDALNEVLVAAIEITTADMGNIRLFDPQNNLLRIVAQQGFQQEFLDHFREVSVDTGSTCSRALQQRQRVIVEDVQQDPSYAPQREIASLAGYRAVQSTPLMSRAGELLGVLSTHYRQPQLPSERDLQLLDLYARQAADFIEHVRNRETTKVESRRKDEFLATLAHELRNPLAPIFSGLQLMRMAEDKAATFEEIGPTMERQTEQMVTLIDDLLDVSRITRGKLELRKFPVQLANVVELAIETSRPLIDDERHELTVNLPAEPIGLHADPHRLAQVLSNLLNNAAKYTPQAGHIELSARRQDSKVAVTVTDDGIGIPANQRERIFEMFGQIDHPLKHSSSGLGIGLTLVKSLVELHEGRIEVHSDGAGRGSEFTVWLPISAEAPIEGSPPQAPEDTADSSSKCRVLVVDDNRDAASMLSQVITMSGHQVRTAGDGDEAIDVAADFRPDLVLMDLGMPKMDGYEAARQMRQQDWGQSMTLVALSGWGKNEDKQKTKEAGFDQHLVKPPDPAQLKRILAGVKSQSH